MNRFIAAFVLAGLLSASALSRTEHVCRFSGELIASCPADASAEKPFATDDGCCERRQVTALDKMRSPGVRPLLALAPILTAPLPVLSSPLACARPARESMIEPRASGPPIFLLQRAWLL